MAAGEREFSGVVDAATPNVTIGVTRHSLAPGVQQIVESNSGDVDPTFIANMLVSPLLSLTTRQMTVLSSFGIAGAAIATADIWYQQKVENGLRNATSKKLTIATGYGAPRTVTASINTPAELAIDMFAKSSDGTTVPIAAGTGTMAANPTPVIHTIGPMKINGTEYQADTFSIDFGLQVVVDTSSGFLYPTIIYVLRRAPTITFTFKDVDARIAIGIEGLQQSATDSTFYLRKLASGGGRVIDATAEHIKFTVDDGMFTINQIEAPHDGEKATYQVTLKPISDGTAAIIVIDTASAIT